MPMVPLAPWLVDTTARDRLDEGEIPTYMLCHSDDATSLDDKYEMRVRRVCVCVCMCRARRPHFFACVFSLVGMLLLREG